MASLAVRLAAFPFVAEMAPAQRAKLAAVVTLRHFPEDTAIVQPDRRCATVPLVERGAVRVMRPGDQELRYYDVRPGDTCVLALAAMLQDKPSGVQGTALAGTDALLVPADVMRATFQQDPAFQRFVVGVFAERLTDLMDLAGAAVFDSLEDRLGDLLRREADDEGVVRLTHAELATMLGSAREVVSRTLDQMKQRGVVELARRRITLLDPQAAP